MWRIIVILIIIVTLIIIAKYFVSVHSGHTVYLNPDPVKDRKRNHYNDHHFTLGRRLGKGKFADGVFYNETFKCATKKIADSKFGINEVRSLQELVHKNIIKLLGFSFKDGFKYIHLENCTGTLQDLLNKKQVIVVFPLALQIIEGVEHIHQHNWIHKDLKPANILLKDGTIKISDFGLAIRKGERNCVGYMPIMGPDAFNCNFSEKTDIFAVALIFAQLLCCGFFKCNVADFKEMKFPEGFQTKFPSWHKLIKQMLSSDPDKRPTATEVVECFKPNRR